MLNRRSQFGTHPLHRMGLGDDLIDVIARDALKHAPLETETRWLDGCQDHWARAFGTEMGLNCDAARIEQDMMLGSVQAGALQNSQSPAGAVEGGDGASMEPARVHSCSVLLTFQRINVQLINEDAFPFSPCRRN